MSRSQRDDPADAVRWWQAYQLAEADRDDALRARANTGDDHARRQLASWLADRRRTGEAISTIRPLADAGDDVASRWLARWLAEVDDAPELRRRALAGDYHARVELAGWLARRERRDELRDLIARSWPELGRWLAAQHDPRVTQLAAEFGDDGARLRLEHWLARVRERAASGNREAARLLAEWTED
jgi:hypothetical protein